MLGQPHRDVFPSPKLGSHCFPMCVPSVMICMKNVSVVEMMIRIPAVMTGEIESWPCEELMYCSRDNVWQKWGFAVLSQASHTISLILCNNWLKKTKYCGKGPPRGACRSKVCLQHPWPRFLYKLALSLSMRERQRRKEGKQRKVCCFGCCLDPSSQNMFVPRNIGFDPGWSCFVPHPFVFVL